MIIFFLSLLSFLPASEPLALLVFGAALFGITAGLRTFLAKNDSKTDVLFQELKSSVVVENEL